VRGRVPDAAEEAALAAALENVRLLEGSR
jgi:exonuclease SbcD